MEIKKWSGLITAASPYAVPPGANVEQNNLQIRKPGQLTPRPGMTVVYQGQDGQMLSLHRATSGPSSADRLLAARYTSSDGLSVDHLVYNTATGAWTQDSIFVSAGTSNYRPTFCQDRHGSTFMFTGYGVAPQTFRYGIDEDMIPFGMVAPTVQPAVTATGDGFFIERVDVIASGTSYYAPPTLTVSGGDPDRAATLRAVVQAGAIVAVDVVDGGSNYKNVPTISVSEETIGTGFQAIGVQVQNPAVYGFYEADAPTNISGTAIAGHTYQYLTANTPPTIAYRGEGGEDAFAYATFDPSTATYTTLIPLKLSGTTTNTYAQVKFGALSSSYKLGTATVDGFSAGTQFTGASSGAATGAAASYKIARSKWYYSPTQYEVDGLSDATADVLAYYKNTQAVDGPNLYTYWSAANVDFFYGLGASLNQYRFAKAQVKEKGVSGANIFGGRETLQKWGSYYFPDYASVSYKLLIGPATTEAMANSANWQSFSSVVKVASGRPYIDVPLRPCKKDNGADYVTTSASRMPTVRLYLAYCPATWTVENNLPYSGQNDWLKRFNPQSGQDRRVNFTDTQSNSGSPNGSCPTLKGNTTADSNTRWWSEGHVHNAPLPRPIVDFRKAAASDAVGFSAGTVDIVDAGAQLDKDTRFAIRFEQFNAYDYRVFESSKSLSWLSSTPSLTRTVTDNTRNGGFGTTYTDFYFQAANVDAVGAVAANLAPGALSGTPKITNPGTGWTAADQTASFRLRHRPVNGTSADLVDAQTFTFTTKTLIAASTQKTIGSITPVSGGQNYFREPTILSRGGGGYGLKVSSTVSDGRVKSVVILDGGDGYSSNTTLYTDVQPAKLMPILRGSMRGRYRCAYRFADYRQTALGGASIKTTAGSRVVTITPTSASLVIKPGYQLTWRDFDTVSPIENLVRIVSISGTQARLSKPATITQDGGIVRVRDMTRPIVYSDFSPITNLDASANGSGRASRMQWSIAGVTAPDRAQVVEFFRTSGDQSLVFYRLDMHGRCDNGSITIVGDDTLSDEELFDPDRSGYAALPVVLPNGGLNAYRFGTARSDMAVGVAWQDRLWYGVSTSGESPNTVFYSEYDEFESCPDINELPIQSNLRTTDYLTSLVPFGSIMVAMQTGHSYSISFNTDPSVDASITLMSHRGCLGQACWDIFDDQIYAADERGIYRVSTNGDVESLSEPIRDYFNEGKLYFGNPSMLYLRIDPKTSILRFFALSGAAVAWPNVILCYHIENKTWWTESYPNSLTCSCDYRLPTTSTHTSIYGAFDGNVYRLDGITDVCYRDIASVTITNPGSGYTSPPTISAGETGKGARFRGVV